jgi:hypothetical protein
MAVLAHPTLGAGGDAPTACAEIVLNTDFSIPPIIPITVGSRLPHPDPSLLSSGGGGDSAVGYAA